MAITVNNPNSSTNLLNKTQQTAEKLNQSLASAKRINRAADDPAGLAITNRLTSGIDSLNVSIQGNQDQVNLNNIQSARLGALTESLQRAQVLSVQSGNPLYQGSSAIQDELNAITEQVNVVAEEALGQSNFLSGLDATNPATSQTAIEAALKTVSEKASALGADSNALNAQVNVYQTTAVNLSESRSRIADTDFAAASSEKAKNETQENVAIQLQGVQLRRRGLLINKLI